MFPTPTTTIQYGRIGLMVCRLPAVAFLAGSLAAWWDSIKGN